MYKLCVQKFIFDGDIYIVYIHEGSQRTMAKKRAASEVKVRMEKAVGEALDNVICYDGGNGNATVVGYRSGYVYSMTQPNLRSAKGRDVGSGGSTVGRHKYKSATFEGQRWAYGENAGEEGAASAHRNNIMRYADEPHVFWCLVCLAEMGYKSGTEFRLVTSIPPSYLREIAPVVQKTFLRDELADKWWKIQVGDQEYCYKFKSVVVLPEGYGSFAALTHTIAGQPIEMKKGVVSPLSGTVYIGDAGNGTYDQYRVVNGRLDFESLANASDTGGGTWDNIVVPVTQSLNNHFKGTVIISPHTVDLWLRRWASGDNAYSPESGKFAYGRFVMDLGDEFRYWRSTYASWVIQNKLDAVESKAYNGYVPTGGGWHLIAQLVKEARPNVPLMLPEFFPHAADYQMWQLNAIGGFSYAAAQVLSKA